MLTPTPLQSFVGGIGLSLAVHGLLVLNGSNFGVSGFIHNAVRGNVGGALSVAGLLLGGVAVGQLEGIHPPFPPIGVGTNALAGFLVGLGTRLSKGCTSGHMVSGLSRLSIRSITATATFIFTGAITTNVLYGGSLEASLKPNWSLKANTISHVALHLVPLALSALAYFYPQQGKNEKSTQNSLRIRRGLVSMFTAFSFAVGLSYSNLTDPSKVTTFLILPFHKAFDPSLLFLATSVLPITVLLYFFGRGKKPLLSDAYSVTSNQRVDARLVLGAAVFGVGWGMTGICPGPGVVNFGRALSTGAELYKLLAWMAAVSLGGFVADLWKVKECEVGECEVKKAGLATQSHDANRAYVK